MTHTTGKRLQAAAIAAVGMPIIEALGATYTWREEGAEHLRQLERDGRPPIFAFWHGRILAATLYFRDRGIIVITSENFDGEWIARIIRRFGYGTARGSHSRGGVARWCNAATWPRASGRVLIDGRAGPARVAPRRCGWRAPRNPPAVPHRGRALLSAQLGPPPGSPEATSPLRLDADRIARRTTRR